MAPRRRCRAGRHILSKVGTYTTWRGLEVCHGCQAEAAARYRQRMANSERRKPVPKFCTKRHHPLVGKNLYLTRYGSYQCLRCQDLPRSAGEAKVAAAVAAGRSCRRGHKRTVANTRVMSDGSIACRICLRAWVAARKADGEYATLRCAEPGCKALTRSKFRPTWYCKAHRKRDTSVISRARSALANAV